MAVETNRNPRQTRDDGSAELFDLAADPNETSDAASQKPEIVARLRERLKELARRDNDALATR